MGKTIKLKDVVLIICLSIALTACSKAGGVGDTDPSVPPSTVSFSGTVMFKGAPLPGVTITAYDTNANAVYQITTTDANGKYSFTGISAAGDVPMDCQFWATKPGYGFYPSVGPGARVVRAGYNGMFEGLNTENPPIIFTVIDFVALPNVNVADANFTAYDGSNPPVTLAQTGQTTSYVSGDDASQQKGAAWPGTRFTDNQNGSVTDNLTGLVWLKNAGCFSPTTWANAVVDVNHLASGACGLTDGSTAGQWRLPNLGELESLVDVSASNPALTSGNPFTNVSNAIYWTSTIGIYPWAIRFSDGSYIDDGIANNMTTSNNAVWAVRGSGGGVVALQATGVYIPFASGDDGDVQSGVPLTYPRWVDNGNGTVTDTVTGLIWLKQADCINQTWSAALSAVNSLASGQCGLTDGSTAGSWRMPNRNEMQSMSDRMQSIEADYFDYTLTLLPNNNVYNLPNNIYQAPIFTNFISQQFYWTSSTDAADTTMAWTTYSCDYGVYAISKNNTGYTLAVR